MKGNKWLIVHGNATPVLQLSPYSEAHEEEAGEQEETAQEHGESCWWDPQLDLKPLQIYIAQITNVWTLTTLPENVTNHL